MDPEAEQWPATPRLVRKQVREVVDSVIAPGELNFCAVVWLWGDEKPDADFVSVVPDVNPDDFLPAMLTLWVRVVAGDQEWWHGTWRYRLSWTSGLRSLGSDLASWVSETPFGRGQHRQALMPPSLPDLRTLTDDEVVGWIQSARGDTRLFLIDTLGFTHGKTGVPCLLSLLSESGPGSVHVRVSAIGALAAREGPKAVPSVLPLLTGGTLELQLAAVWAIQKLDDGRYSNDVLAWFARRLRAKNRANTYGDYELSGLVRYAMQVGALPDLAELLHADLALLQPGEVEHLDRAWPPQRRDRSRTTHVTEGPNPDKVEDWYRISALEDTPTDERREHLTEFIGPEIQRLQKRASQPGK